MAFSFAPVSCANYCDLGGILYADLKTTKYRRTFVLGGELETERIEATLKDGLLTVRIPKRVEFRTRKIKVNVP